MPPSPNRIAYYRDRCTPPLTQARLAQALGKHVNSIYLWEKQGVPTAADLLCLTRLFVERGALADSETVVSFWDCSGRERFEHPPELRRLFAPAASEPFTLPDAPSPPGVLPAKSLMSFRPNPLFVGRESEMCELARVLIAGDAAITGLAGIGKTQLACEFAHRYGQFFPGGVFWMSFADANSVPAEIASCGGAGRLELRPDFSSLSRDDQVRLVQAAWQQPIARLLIFDNCEDEALATRWRPASGGCRVLITSRRANWSAPLGITQVPLPPLRRTESVALLHKRRLAVAAKDADLEAIAVELGDLPLALNLAGSYLERYRDIITPAAYLAQIRGLPMPALQSLQSNEISPTGHTQNIAHTFALICERLHATGPADRLAHDLLQRAAFFAPGEPIPRELLVATLESAPDRSTTLLDIEDALAKLVGDLGLLETSARGELRMHRLVVAFVRASGDTNRAETAVEQAVLAAAQRLNEERLPSDMLKLHAHLRAVTDAACQRADAHAADLCAVLGWQLVLLSAFDDGLAYLQRALTFRRQVFGDEHSAVADSLSLLGLCYQFQSAFVQSRPHLERALVIWERVLGPEHIYTAEAHNNLGYLLFHMGEPDTAQAHLRRALRIRRRALGLLHPNTARTLNNLGYVLLHDGKLAAARRYLRLALAIRERVLPPINPATAQTLNNLGEVMFAEGKYICAFDFHTRALEMRDAIFSTNRFHAAESMRNLARVLYAQKQYAAAYNYIEQSIALCEEGLGAQHMETAWKLATFGEMLLGQGELARAEQYLTRALAVYSKLHCPSHRDIRQIKAGLAAIARRRQPEKGVRACRLGTEQS